MGKSHRRFHWRSARRLVFFSGLLGAGGAISFLVLLIALHVLRPDLSPAGSYVSDYANGRFGDLFRTAAVFHGFGNMVMAGGFASVLARSRLGRWGAALFGAAAAGIILGGVFSIDAPGAPRTIAGTIHTTVASAAFPIEAVALMLLWRTFGIERGWHSFSVITFAAAAGGSAALVWFLVAVMAGSEPGLAERAVFAVFLSWEILAAIFLMRNGPSAAVA